MKNSRIAPATRGISSTANLPAASTQCNTCGGSSAPASSLARYDKDGECASVCEISCESQWQMRECLKLAACEFISCLGEQFCVDGSFQQPSGKELEDVLLCCLGDSFCTLLQCLPNAICGPRQNTDCIPPPPALDCNFAVEEKN